MNHICKQDEPNCAHDLPKIDGCHCAIVGVTDDEKVAYSYQLLVEHFIDQFSDDGVEDSYNDNFHTMALEWVDHNIVSAAHGLVVIIYDVLD